MSIKQPTFFSTLRRFGFMGSPRREGLARLSCMSIAALRTLGAELLILERRRTLSSL